MYTPTQLAAGKSAAIAAGISNPTQEDIEAFAQQPLDDESAEEGKIPNPTVTIDAATLASDLNDLVAEAKANKMDIQTFLAKIEGIILPILTKVV